MGQLVEDFRGNVEWKRFKEYASRKDTKHAETQEFYLQLERKWASYRLAKPNLNLPKNPPSWWLKLEVNQPEYEHGMWIKNLPIADSYDKKRITQNAPGDPNI